MKKRILMFFLFASVLLPVVAKGGRLEKSFVQREGSDGILYFVFERQMPAVADGGGQKCKKLKYDYTYLDSGDSVVMLMTVKLEHQCSFRSLSFVQPGSETLSCPVGLLFCLPSKGKWEYRLRCVFPYAEWRRLYGSTAPFVLTFHASECDLSFADPSKTWAKTSGTLRDIQGIVELNRKRVN